MDGLAQVRRNDRGDVCAFRERREARGERLERGGRGRAYKRKHSHERSSKEDVQRSLLVHYVGKDQGRPAMVPKIQRYKYIGSSS